MKTGPLISIGAHPKSVKEVSATILAILRAPNVDNKTKIAAIKAVETAARVENTNISNCNFTG